MTGRLILQDGTDLKGESFGYQTAVSGEVVFSTGMVGYPESLTDPSYLGQILILTYPLIGNYGIPKRELWESSGIKVSGLIVSSYIDTPFHHQSTMTLSTWLMKEKVPALVVKDTRFLAKKIRNHGVLLGKIVFRHDIPFYDPQAENLVAKASRKQVTRYGNGRKKLILIDCGTKQNIIRILIRKNVTLYVVPWDYDILKNRLAFDGIVISNGPGNPKTVKKTIEIVKKAFEFKIPTLGICLGSQILALAAGGDTYKLKFGHRSQNQPCKLSNSPRCYLTTQNHGYAVREIPSGFTSWFTNVNDGTNEGIIHSRYPIMAIQFHPEASPGPTDTEWIFDYFLEKI
ncbi:glutamine-hydrolyzing carbamoyl-phosphate synthase small subunit [Candidatus Roizmanbacteria bacterium]|nr:glutamine-hydrolyzing carbamoyl-phosphate synthase small subunit [Candidatus Roizmanbacteria bacterium]